MNEYVELLKDYEKWEASIILEGESWQGSLPTITQEQYDTLLELQHRRNKLLSKVPNKEYQNKILNSDKTDIEKWNEFVTAVAVFPGVGIRKKMVAINKFERALIKRNNEF